MPVDISLLCSTCCLQGVRSLPPAASQSRLSAHRLPPCLLCRPPLPPWASAPACSSASTQMSTPRCLLRCAMLCHDATAALHQPASCSTWLLGATHSNNSPPAPAPHPPTHPPNPPAHCPRPHPLPCRRCTPTSPPAWRAPSLASATPTCSGSWTRSGQTRTWSWWGRTATWAPQSQRWVGRGWVGRVGRLSGSPWHCIWLAPNCSHPSKTSSATPGAS